MENELKVKITGDVADLKTALNDGEKSVDKFGKTTQKAEKDTGSLKEGAGKLGKQLKSLAGDAQSAEGSIESLAEGLGSGGLLGISLAVFGAIGLFISKVQEAQAEIGALAEAQSKAVGAAQAEIAALEGLLRIAGDETKSREERQRALSQINAQYPDYLGNLKLEELGNEDARKQVDLLTESLIRQAKIKGAQDLIAKESAKLFDTLASGPLAAADSVDILQAALQSLGSVGRNFSFTQNLVSQGFDTQGKIIEETEKKIKAYQDALNALLDEDVAVGGLTTKDGDKATRKAQEEAAKAAAKISEKLAKEKEKLAKESAKILKSVDAQLFKDQEEAAKEHYREMASLATEAYHESGAQELNASMVFTDEGAEEQLRMIEEIEKALKKLKGSVSEEQFQIISTYNIDELKAFSAELENTKIVSEAVGTGIATVFDVMGDKLAKSTDESSSALSRFASTLGASVLKIMATYLSQSIAAAIAGGASSGSSTGPGAIVAIPTMIASLTAAVIGAFAAIPKFASGGIVPGGSFNGDTVPALLNSGEMVLNARQQANLFSQFNRAGGYVSGDRQPIEVTGVLRGEDILLSSTRARKVNERFGA